MSITKLPVNRRRRENIRLRRAILAADMMAALLEQIAGQDAPQTAFDRAIKHVLEDWDLSRGELRRVEESAHAGRGQPSGIFADLLADGVTPEDVA